MIASYIQFIIINSITNLTKHNQQVNIITRRLTISMNYCLYKIFREYNDSIYLSLTNIINHTDTISSITNLLKFVV